jgi:hypothetical protein
MRAVSTGVSGIGAGVTIAYLLGLSTLSMVVGGVVLGVLSIATKSVVVPLLSVALGFSLLCVSISAFGAIRFFPAIEGSHLLVFFCVAVSIVAIGLAASLRLQFSYSESAVAAIVLIIGCLLRGRFPASNGLAFQTLSTVGEDNAAWLQALANSSTPHGSIFGVPSLFGGGTGTGASLTLFRQGSAMFSDQFTRGMGPNGLILLRGSLLLAVLSAAITAVVTVRLLARVPWYSRVVSGVIAGLLAYTLTTGMSATGHYSAVLATFILSAGALAALLLREAPRFPVFAISSVTVIATIAAGLSWFPLMPLAMVLSGGFALFLIVAVIRQQPSGRRRMMTVLLSVFAGLALMWLMRRIFSSVLDNLSWDYFTFNMSLSGGVQSVSGILALAGLCAVVFVCGTRLDHDHRTAARITGAVLPMGIAIYCVAVYLVSFVGTPYSPKYGAVKLLYLTSSISVPLVAVCASIIVSRARASKLVHISVGPLVLVTLALFDPSRVFFAWPKSVELKADWAPAVVREITRKPDRRVVCLNTTTDPGQDIWGYICTRMTAGLQGAPDTSASLSSYQFNTWTAANIGQIGPEQAATAWDEEFYRTLTILVFDPARRDNGDPRQIAWLADVDWTAVRIIGPDGKVVKRAGVSPADLTSAG